MIIERTQYEALVRAWESKKSCSRTHSSQLQANYEYTALRTALISGGVPPENLDLLISGPESNIPVTNDPRVSSVKLIGRSTRSTDTKAFVPKSHLRDDWSSCHSPLLSPQNTSLTGDENGTATAIEGSDAHDDYQELGEQMDQTNEQERSLTLQGLSPFTSLADILEHIRGGQVLQVYRRQNSAHVTFVDPAAAGNFLTYSKRADLYICGKRVSAVEVLQSVKTLTKSTQIDVFRDDRQCRLSSNIARRIEENGATRNLVIRFPKHDMTSDSIKEDLNHIWRLQVVRIKFSDGHAYVSLNSIQAACIARSCMISRLKYKGTRIEFYPDECSEPLPPILKKNLTQKSERNLRPNLMMSRANRYAALAAMDPVSTYDDNSEGVVVSEDPTRNVLAYQPVVK